MKTKSFLIAAMAIITFIGCKNDPKVIPAADAENNNASGIFSGDSDSKVDFNNVSSASNEFHSVVVKEVLPTSKYVYLNVTENGGEPYWIASRSMKVNVGETYYYKGGLLKTNFESKEYDRVFDRVYLISSLISASEHGKEGASPSDESYTPVPSNMPKVDIEMHTEKVVHHQGSMKISELVNNPKKFEGQTVQLDGVCTKINAGIMNRNWIHIKDGTMDDYDLVVTSDAYVPEGALFTIKAQVVLNKDFGAGYKYDLILENGTLIK
ncbi:hypothetical protein WJN01_06600 [Flavobacteriaceae bacterium SZ-1-7]|uniref:hypothetical protein n=1 Tax=Tamlana sedimenti TaxID=3134126 RepID=UPI003127805B